ncbi:fasciclin domain-containing protein [Leptolyngbya sp. BC1307]|uniref:fasciclin domain-containing protein n=1 Tax=Leptolyngbya sp. BC1307 TaxID=2029589 RepID=UPI000EFB1578|nr:fasciclin domain-containing protein [Leptolyngbya sp. BC1307]
MSSISAQQIKLSQRKRKTACAFTKLNSLNLIMLTLAIGVYDSGVVVNNASVTQADIQASNGVIHQVNRVLVPEALQRQLASRLGVSSLYQ